MVFQDKIFLRIYFFYVPGFFNKHYGFVASHSCAVTKNSAGFQPLILFLKNTVSTYKKELKQKINKNVGRVAPTFKGFGSIWLAIMCA